MIWKSHHIGFLFNNESQQSFINSRFHNHQSKVHWNLQITYLKQYEFFWELKIKQITKKHLAIVQWIKLFFSCEKNFSDQKIVFSSRRPNGVATLSLIFIALSTHPSREEQWLTTNPFLILGMFYGTHIVEYNNFTAWLTFSLSIIVLIPPELLDLSENYFKDTSNIFLGPVTLKRTKFIRVRYGKMLQMNLKPFLPQSERGLLLKQNRPSWATADHLHLLKTAL